MADSNQSKGFFESLYDFFVSKETPNSGFYLTLLGALGTIGASLLSSNDPILMAIGGGIVAVYAASNAIGNAIEQSKKVQQVSIMPITPVSMPNYSPGSGVVDNVPLSSVTQLPVPPVPPVVSA